MMRVHFVLLFFIILVISCQNGENKKLPGTWELIEFTLVSEDGEKVSDKETLRNAGAVWNLEFSEEGDFEQEFNMRDPGMKMEEEKGTWKIVGDSLKIDLQIDMITSTLPYTYQFKDDTLILTLTNQQYNSKVITKFRKK